MRAPRRHGFALLEATAALFVATFGVFGVVQVFNAATDEIRTVQEKEIAGRLLRNEMEYLTALPFAQLVPGNADSFKTPAPELPRLHLAAPNVEISSHADLPDTLRVVTVRLRWISTHGRPVEHELTTMVARGAS